MLCRERYCYGKSHSSVRPSVCVVEISWSSHMFEYFENNVMDDQRRLCALCGPQRHWSITLWPEVRGWGIKAVFWRTKCSSICKTGQDRTKVILLLRTNTKSHTRFRYVPIKTKYSWMTLKVILHSVSKQMCNDVVTYLYSFTFSLAFTQ